MPCNTMQFKSLDCCQATGQCVGGYEPKEAPMLVDRGSTGYGEEALQSLPGNIGTNDVSDCMTALDFAIEEGNGAQS